MFSFASRKKNEGRARRDDGLGTCRGTRLACRRRSAFHMVAQAPDIAGICRGLVQRHGSLGGHHGLERALTPSSFSRFHFVNPSISSHPREDISPVPTTRCSFKMNLNLSASLNIFKLISRPSLCLPHATVGTFNDLPVPLDRLFSKPGRSVDIRAVVLDKDDCFAYPEESTVYDSYKVYHRAVCQSFIFVEHNPCSTSAFACRKSG